MLHNFDKYITINIFIIIYMIDSNIIRTLSLVFLIYLVFIMSKEKIGILNCSLNRLIKKRYIFFDISFCYNICIYTVTTR